MNTETRKLYRSRDDRKIAGVCGGLGEYFGIDPLLVRLIFVVALEVTPLLYVLMWIFVPEKPLE